ncbi:hypothetical protein BCM14_1447 [Jezberella montanilacus]|uniref:Uncharacterized protein n=1 Tax=Jezberella montanilacus TaxID=323426 RepID=A0A2T0XI35_9BURK|nr:hypothetical protein BCM14_1447 [Jezberella montanilacus]
MGVNQWGLASGEIEPFTRVATASFLATDSRSLAL